VARELVQGAMETSRCGPCAAYLGIDLTDRHARRPRAVDVCGLDATPGGLAARFWTWTWAGGELGAVAGEFGAAESAMIDGPQALAAEGRSLRACERLCRAAGKTPDRLDRCAGPYAGFVRTSVELFAALDRAGLAVSPPGLASGVCEVYPGHLWTRLAPGLAKKATALGLRQRAAILSACGVALADAALTHDRLDATLAALAAAAARGAAPGLAVVPMGEPLRRRPTGELEEGPIASLAVEGALARRIARAVGVRGTS
jgi:Protein of unknown function (DUF429)